MQITGEKKKKRLLASSEPSKYTRRWIWYPISESEGRIRVLVLTKCRSLARDGIVGARCYMSVWQHTEMAVLDQRAWSFSALTVYKNWRPRGRQDALGWAARSRPATHHSLWLIRFLPSSDVLLILSYLPMIARRLSAASHASECPGLAWSDCEKSHIFFKDL